METDAASAAEGLASSAASPPPEAPPQQDPAASAAPAQVDESTTLAEVGVVTTTALEVEAEQDTASPPPGQLESETPEQELTPAPPVPPPRSTPPRLSPPKAAPPQTAAAPPTPPPPPPTGSKKHIRPWWGQKGQAADGSPRSSRSHSRSREGSPLVQGKGSSQRASKSIADMVISALVHAAGSRSLSPRASPTPSRPTSLQAAPAAAPAPKAEEVPNITFTFLDTKDSSKAPARAAVEDDVTPDEEWEDVEQRDKEVTETVVCLQRASMALTSDGDDEFVDARGSSSESEAASPAVSPGPPTATAPPTLHEEPEYACVQKPALPATPTEGGANASPIYRSLSYSSAVEEGLYSCPRPQTAPPPPPGPSTAPPPLPPPPVPEPDWTSTDSGSNQATSEYASYYVFPNSEPPSLDPAGRQEYEELEYCSSRASQRRPSRPLSTTDSVALPPNGTAGGGGLGALHKVHRVRSRLGLGLGRAWRSVRGWWGEERARLEDTFMKHVHAQAVGAYKQPSSPRSTAQSCDHLDDQEDDFDDEEQGDVSKGAAVKGDEAGVGNGVRRQASFKRAVSVPTIPRMLVLRRRKDSEQTSTTSISTWGRGRRPGSALRRSRFMPEGQNGFEELRRYIKHGGDFCKDLTSILQERAEAEQVYAKSLAKLSAKLLKASKGAAGTVGQAWQRIGTEMECQGEVHRTFSVALGEEVVKPLRQLVDSQHRIRKSVESTVDKTAKTLSEWRQAEAKSKKTSFMCARDNEKLQDAMVEGRQSTRGSSLHLHHAVHNKMSDKDVAKLETKRRKAEDSVKKADVEYYTFCIRAERARLEWETAVLRGSYCLQAIEEERLQNLKELASMYLRHLKEMGPKMVQSSDRLNEPVQSCDVAADIQTVVSLKGTGQPPSEQLLPDFYAEHVTLGMNRDRRKQALAKVLQLIKQDLERERRSKQGVENLARALQQTPNFGAEDSQQNVTEKLHHMRSMLTYLEAARYKVQSVLAELEGRPNQTHPLSSHIIVHRDRQGLQQSILKVPPWVRKDSLDQMNGESPDWMDRGAADGNSVQPDSDFDEFSSQGSEKDFNSSLIISECASTAQTNNNPSVGTCRALYQYAANLYDELNLNPGDVINIHDKQDDGWWLGELNGTVGIFPATYVEEIK